MGGSLKFTRWLASLDESASSREKRETLPQNNVHGAQETSAAVLQPPHTCTYMYTGMFSKALGRIRI